MPLSGLQPSAVVQRRELPEDALDLAHKKQVNKTLSALADGAVNWVVEFALATGSPTTVVQAVNLTVDSQISLQPLNANAAALLTDIYIDLPNMIPGTAWSGQQTGSFTVNHPLLVVGTVASYRASVKG